MALDYVSLSRDLQETVRALTPPSLLMSDKDLYRHFRDRLEVQKEAVTNRPEKDHKSLFRNSALTTLASMGAAGSLVVAGPVVAPAAFTVMLGTAGYAVARAIVNKVQGRRERDDKYRLTALLGMSVEAQRTAVVLENDRGFFKRLYEDVTDRFKRYDSHAQSLIDRIDNLQPSGIPYALAVQNELDKVSSPGFADYMRRTATEKHSSAAHLMARLKTIADVEALFPPEAPAQPALARSALASVGVRSFGLGLGSREPAHSAQAITMGSNLPSGVGQTGDITYYGCIRAEEGDADLLRSYGVELGPYDHAAGVFNAKASPDAYALILPLNGHIGSIDMNALDSSIKDAASVAAKIPVERMTKAQLSAYGACLSFEEVTDLPFEQRDPAAHKARFDARWAIGDEWQRRQTVERSAAASLKAGNAPAGVGLEL
ncbi:hypothetical protein R70006_06250 [Paraburkholderia domus]|uniref:hypothetical protein n=1 Tax=Paraburkholderia domus TaxID=2793075 RepID=UPI0019149646|nr:hypothetical protein [Paraburkholderia domus]MBK5052882.1 hypothetical protein [Burkholderia sp. R-70006]CAE6822086.1 hypothetical protein R70006_06250 [Paraburkholderia domus]